MNNRAKLPGGTAFNAPREMAKVAREQQKGAHGDWKGHEPLYRPSALIMSCDGPDMRE